MARRKYIQEYKQEAVLLVKQSGLPIAEIARNLGINYHVLRRWVKEYSEPGKKAFPGQGNARDEEVARLMQVNAIAGIPSRKQWRKRKSGSRPSDIENHLNRDFTATEENTKWVTDITYIRTGEGWLYLAVIVISLMAR